MTPAAINLDELREANAKLETAIKLINTIRDATLALEAMGVNLTGELTINSIPGVGDGADGLLEAGQDDEPEEETIDVPVTRKNGDAPAAAGPPQAPPPAPPSSPPGPVAPSKVGGPTAAVAATTDRRNRILDYLELRGSWVGPSELRRELDLDKQAIKRDLKALLGTGHVEHNGANTVARRYRLAGTTPPVQADHVTDEHNAGGKVPPSARVNGKSPGADARGTVTGGADPRLRPSEGSPQGRVLLSLSAGPATATELALRLEDLNLAEVELALERMNEEGELLKAGTRGGRQIWTPALPVGA